MLIDTTSRTINALPFLKNVSLTMSTLEFATLAILALSSMEVFVKRTDNQFSLTVKNVSLAFPDTELWEVDVFMCPKGPTT